MRGTMIWFNEEKNHGYISTEEGERLYVSGTGFYGGKPPKGRCGGLEVEFEVTGANGTREASECILVEAGPQARARRRHRAGR
jgi:cold shock CspA family protein